MITAGIDDAVRNHGDSDAVIDGTETLSYRELAARRDVLALHLRRKVGLSAGDVVALWLPNSWEFIATFLAIVRIGAIGLPVNLHWRHAERTWLAGRVRVTAVITSGADVQAWSGIILDSRVVRSDDPAVWSAAEADGLDFPVRRFEDDPALYLTTSGSTGCPKIVPRTHRIVRAGAAIVARALGEVAKRRFLSVVPFYHANGVNNSMRMPLLHGGTVVPMRGFTPAALIETVVRNRIEVLIGSPFIFHMLVDHGAGPEDFSSVNLCLSSGAPMGQALAALAKDRLGLRVRQLYGSTQTGTISIERGDEAEREGSVGTPLDGVEVRILGGGEIAVRSAAVTHGYFGEPDENACRFRDGFFLTGDLGALEPDGSLSIQGRIRRWINAAGVKVDPVEIEEVLRVLPKVAECHVTGLRDRRQTEMVKAIIVVKPGLSLTRKEVVEHCRARLAEYKIPRVIEFTEGGRTETTGKRPVAWEASNGVSGASTQTVAAHGWPPALGQGNATPCRGFDRTAFCGGGGGRPAPARRAAGSGPCVRRPPDRRSAGTL